MFSMLQRGGVIFLFLELLTPTPYQSTTRKEQPRGIVGVTKEAPGIRRVKSSSTSHPGSPYRVPTQENSEVELTQPTAGQASSVALGNNDSNHTASSESRNHTSTSKPKPRLSYSAYDSDETSPEAYEVIKKFSLEDGRHFFSAKKSDQTRVRLVTLGPEDDRKDLILHAPQPFRDTDCLKQVKILQRALAISTTLLVIYFVLEAILFSGPQKGSYLLMPLVAPLVLLVVSTVQNYLLVHGRNIAHHTLNLCVDRFVFIFYAIGAFFFLFFLGWAIGNIFYPGKLPVTVNKRRRVTYHAVEITLAILGVASTFLGIKEQYTDYKDRKEHFLPIREEVNGRYKEDFLID